MLVVAVPAGAVTITEFPVEPGAAAGTHAPRYIHVGPDQNLWFADSGHPNAGIGRISTAGEGLPTIGDPDQPVDLVTAPDGTVYWTADGGLGQRTPSGSVNEFGQLGAAEYAIALTSGGDVRFTERAGAPYFRGYACRFTSGFSAASIKCQVAGGTRLTGLTLAADGRLWVAGYEENRVRRMDAGGTTFDLTLDLPVGSGPSRLALGADGNLWVTMYDASAIDRFAPSGARTRFPLPVGRGPNDIVAGPDGALWFTELKAGKIGRMTTDGALTNEFDIPSPDSQPIGITAGPDGAIWFTESATGKIGRLQLDAAGGGGGGLSDHFAPRFLRAAAFNPNRFRVASAATPTTARRRVTPKGSSLTYSLSEPAAVTIVIAQPRSGRRVGKSCRAPTRSNRRKRRCTRYVTVGTLRRRGLQGANKVVFTGRIGRRALAAGSYRATATAKDSAGNVSKTSTAAFTILS